MKEAYTGPIPDVNMDGNDFWMTPEGEYPEAPSGAFISDDPNDRPEPTTEMLVEPKTNRLWLCTVFYYHDGGVESIRPIHPVGEGYGLEEDNNMKETYSGQRPDPLEGGLRNWLTPEGQEPESNYPSSEGERPEPKTEVLIDPKTNQPWLCDILFHHEGHVMFIQPLHPVGEGYGLEEDNNITKRKNKPQQVTSKELFAMSKELTSTHGLGYVIIATSSTLEGASTIARKEIKKGFTPIAFTIGYQQNHPEYDDPDSRFRILLVKEPDTIPVEFEEDNIYQHMNLMTRNNYSFAGYNFDMNRDPFEWELNSTKQMSRAFVIDTHVGFEVRFEVLNDAKLPAPWRKVLGPHNIHSVLKVSVGKFMADTNYMKLLPDTQPLNPSSEFNLIKTIGKVMLSYYKVWGKNHFQIVVFNTGAGQRVNFLKALGKKLATIPGLKPYDKIAAELMGVQKQFFVVFKNIYGSPIHEDVDFPERKIGGGTAAIYPIERLGQNGIDESTNEETDSSAFAAAPENASAWVRGKTGDELSRDARKHLDQMMHQGMSAQLTDYEEPKKLKEGQIKVCQNYSRDHIDIIDVIDRESEGRLFGDNIQYKGKNYSVHNHPRIGAYIAIT